MRDAEICEEAIQIECTILDNVINRLSQVCPEVDKYGVGVAVPLAACTEDGGFVCAAWHRAHRIYSAELRLPAKGLRLTSDGEIDDLVARFTEWFATGA